MSESTWQERKQHDGQYHRQNACGYVNVGWKKQYQPLF